MNIGFIGLGTMGRGMAANLLKAGHHLFVHDVSRASADSLLDAGAVWCARACDVAGQSELIFTSLPTPADVEHVGLGADGLVHQMAPGTAWFDLSTNSVDVVRRIGTALDQQGLNFLDAPISGGPAGAQSGRLAIWVGGCKEIYEHHLSVLRAMADEPRYIGAIGAGTIAKLVNNMASTAINSVVVEALSLGVKAGVELLPLWEAIRNSVAGRKRSFDNTSGRFLQGKLDPPNFALRLLQKDIALALQLGREHNVPLRLANLVAQDITEAVNRGWSERDSQSFLQLQTERSNLSNFSLAAEEVERVLNK